VRTEDPDVWAQVPKEGLVLQVQVPVGLERRPGGCSLADIQPLLQAQDKVPEDITQAEGWLSKSKEKASENEKEADLSVRTVEVMVQRSGELSLYAVLSRVFTYNIEPPIYSSLAGKHTTYVPHHQGAKRQNWKRICEMGRLLSAEEFRTGLGRRTGDFTEDAEVQRAVQRAVGSSTSSRGWPS
jgi:hypothetical protein